ncbi:MAG: hypothetical protein ACOYLB_14075 [Phototrophicaceae bacterium]
MTNAIAVDSKLLEILRCPVAVHYTDHGADPGKLELVRDGHWLACADSGYKYPIIQGIPKMLIEEGEKWKATPIEELPVPPPHDPLPEVAEDALTPENREALEGLMAQAHEARTQAAQQLKERAQSIRAQAQAHTSQAVRERAEQVAHALEAQADSLSELTSAPTTPTVASSSGGQPLLIGAGLFLSGLVFGWMTRRRNK